MNNAHILFVGWLVVALCILSIVILAYKIYFRPRHLNNIATKWVLLIVFLIFSPLAYLLNFVDAVEESKSVTFCNSCHVMNGYIDDMKDPDSEYLASLHYQYRWIAGDQCFNCHSDYGLTGNTKAKISGMRHVWVYYIAGYKTPIEIYDTYSNGICLRCHAPVIAYQDIEEHEEYASEIESNKQSCLGVDCHVRPHPEDLWENE